MVVTKTRYGDALSVARRARAVSLAAELRWNLLPPLTFTSPDIVVTGMLEPAYDIAGDTFDYAINGDHAHIGLFDAMGHGLEACRMANLAVGSYQHSRRTGADLIATTSAMDAEILAQFGESRFVTGQLATLELESGTLTVINAGHPPPTVFHADGTYEELPVEPSPPIGLDVGARTTLSAQLREGDMLLFHTDGITEARPAEGVDFGVERLRGLVCSLLKEDLRPAEVIRRVILAVMAHGKPLRDDATLVLVGWRLGDRAVPPVIRAVTR
jgi:serine phosphatase RsbU (regulator of sigma subunit)